MPSFRVMKWFNLTPSVDYSEIWYFTTTEKQLDPTLTIDTSLVEVEPDVFEERYDTTGYGEVVDLRKFGLVLYVW